MATKGSMKLKCKTYRDRGIRGINRKRKLNKHLVKHPNDLNAIEALKVAA